MGAFFCNGLVFVLFKCQKCVMQDCYCEDLITFHYSKLCIKWTQYVDFLDMETNYLAPAASRLQREHV